MTYNCNITVTPFQHEIDYVILLNNVTFQKYNVTSLISVITTNVQVTVVMVYATIVVRALANAAGLEMIAISLLGVTKNSPLLGYCWLFVLFYCWLLLFWSIYGASFIMVENGHRHVKNQKIKAQVWLWPIRKKNLSSTLNIIIIKMFKSKLEAIKKKVRLFLIRRSTRPISKLEFSFQI